MKTRVTGWISQGPNVAYKVDLTFETEDEQGEALPRPGYFGTTFTKREEIETILKGAARGSRFEIDYEFGLTADRPHTETILIETVELPSVFPGKDGIDALALLAVAHPGTDRPSLRRYLSPRIRSLTPVRKGA